MSERIQVENKYASEIVDTGFRIYRGWGHSMIQDIIARSQEDHIRRFTPNDAERRFKTPESTQEWLSDEARTVYTLNDGQVAGMIWYTETPREDLDARYTFGIRMYEKTRGKKLAEGFMRAVHSDFATLTRNPRVWLETGTDNAAALHLYEKFGYQEVSRTDERVTMVYGD